ncbi:TRAP transporter small permease [Roseibium salinum]|uniref:TRAP transporter small permease protein n=1 Tax=Roseibium salinum TaxID=1604349 RepID=A0ABT3QVX9_9HYPH|nr:TRAP transporter small permease subunit [Roseibium sp. DSM 29163]MCX2721080.1 TRAP transporter small permease subunit [Roseibium sp. DSM 29163]MDN3722542.1 TRAP transporter small permease subunit [Roseibium salinum]
MMLRRVEFSCAALLLAAVVLLVGVASLARAAGSPIIWSIEVAQLLFLWLCIFAIDLALQDERHFGISLLLDNVPLVGRRAIETLNLIVVIGLLLYLIQFAWKNMVLMHPRLDGALQIPGSYFHASMVLGFALMIRTLLVRLVTSLRRKG